MTMKTMPKLKKTISVDELISITDHDYGFLRHCGEEARRWLDEFQEEETLAILNRISTALVTLRRYEVTAGLDMLAAVEEEIQARTGGFPSLTQLLERYRISTRAYGHYLDGDLEQAKASLRMAHDKVRTIIGLNEFLLPMAIQCTDFIIQRARVARREKRWKEAALLIRTIHDIYSGVSPLCVLDSGRPVGIADIQALFASLPLDAEEWEAAHRLIGTHIPVAKRVEYLEETIFTLPDLVIPYP